MLRPRGYTGLLFKDDTIQRLYKLQLFIVIVLPLLLVIINRMLGNSLARVNETRLMEGGPGKPGDERREQGVRENTGASVCRLL